MSLIKLLIEIEAQLWLKTVVIANFMGIIVDSEKAHFFIINSVEYKFRKKNLHKDFEAGIRSAEIGANPTL